MTYELGYDNLFLFEEWSNTASCRSTTAQHGGTMTVDHAGGSFTLLNTAASGEVYTDYRTNGDTAEYYMMPVTGGVPHTMNLSLASGGTFTGSADVYLFYFNRSGAFLGQTYVSYGSAGAKSFEFTPPASASHAQIRFDVNKPGDSVVFSGIRVCPTSQCSGVTYSETRKAYEHADGATYGELITPERPGYSFSGWFTGMRGTGTRVTRYGQTQARSTTLYAKWSSPFQFGSNGCSTIEMRPFERICSHPDIGGSAAMTLNIPVPTFAPVTPPQECVCFEFEAGEATAEVKTGCKDTKTEFKLEIEQSEDCCSGKYVIKPVVEVTVPCIPFDVTKDTETPSINVGNMSGDEDKGVDGAVDKLELVRDDCCTVRPVIDITFPDCVKGYDPRATPDDQITYCENVGGEQVTKTHKLITMVQDPEHCSLYPKVTPITIPCCSDADWTKTVSKKLSNKGGKITLTMSRVNCDLDFSMSISQINIPNPVIDASGNQIGNGGPVFMSATDGNLYLDGSLDDGDTVWYGGGVGNRGDDDIEDHDGNEETHEALIYCRGPAMRNGENASDADLAALKIPYVEDLANQQLTTIDGKSTTPGWSSSRKHVDSQGTTTKADEPDKENHAFGILDMVMPSGFQWHKRGVAGVLSHFVWDSGGTLSLMNETRAAVLLSPAPASWDASYITGHDTTFNASGLKIDLGSTAHMLSGLKVDCGTGLRIFGRIDEGTTDSSEVTGDNAEAALTKMGKLEVYSHSGDFSHAGMKLTLNDLKSATEKIAMTPGSSMMSGYIDYYSRTGDYTIPIVTANCDPDEEAWESHTYATGKSNLRMAFDEEIEDMTEAEGTAATKLGTLTNALEAALEAALDGADPTAVAEIIGNMWGEVMTVVRATIAAVDTIAYNIQSLRAVYMHVGQAGMIMGIDANQNSNSIQRHSIKDNTGQGGQGTGGTGTGGTGTGGQAG